VSPTSASSAPGSAPPTDPRRVVVKGGSGSGKTTLAAELARRLGVPHVELDALHHGANWQEASAAELAARVEAALDDGRGWVVDGNYEGKLGTLVLDRADLVVWLDLPLRIKLGRLWRRTTRRIRTGEELWNGNRESWRGAFWGTESLFAWTVRTHVRNRREWPARLDGRPVVRLRSVAEVDRFLRQVPTSTS
jgi:adenylate kinase family enzyme